MIWNASLDLCSTGMTLMVLAGVAVGPDPRGEALGGAASGARRLNRPPVTCSVSLLCVSTEAPDEDGSVSPEARVICPIRWGGENFRTCANARCGRARARRASVRVPWFTEPMRTHASTPMGGAREAASDMGRERVELMRHGKDLRNCLGDFHDSFYFFL